MTDDRSLDDLLARAAASPADDPRVATALAALAERADRRRRAPVVAIAAVGAVALVLSGGAVAATVFGPWLRVPDPVFAFERVWLAPDGTVEGTCRSQWMLAPLPEPVRAEAIGVLEQLDVDSIDPDEQRLGELRDRLASGELDSWNWTDVHVRQRALELTIGDRLLAELERRGIPPEQVPDLEVETQCSVVPAS